MDRDEFLRLQREAEAAEADAAEMRDLVEQIAEQKRKLAVAEAALAAVEGTNK